MPKKNFYVTEELAELIDGSDPPLPLSEICQKAVREALNNIDCPTCGQHLRQTKPAAIIRVKKRKVRS